MNFIRKVYSFHSFEHYHCHSYFHSLGIPFGLHLQFSGEFIFPGIFAYFDMDFEFVFRKLNSSKYVHEVVCFHEWSNPGQKKSFGTKLIFVFILPEVAQFDKKIFQSQAIIEGIEGSE